MTSEDETNRVTRVDFREILNRKKDRQVPRRNGITLELSKRYLKMWITVRQVGRMFLYTKPVVSTLLKRGFNLSNDCFLHHKIPKFTSILFDSKRSWWQISIKRSTKFGSELYYFHLLPYHCDGKYGEKELRSLIWEHECFVVFNVLPRGKTEVQLKKLRSLGCLE